MRVYTRREWGARFAAGAGAVRLPVAETWLHHTVTAAPRWDIAAECSAMRHIEAIGQSRFRQGFSYTFAVMPSGRVYEGTGPGRLGSHTGGRNSRSHGIVLVGNYESSPVPEPMVNGVAGLLALGKRMGWWHFARLNGGHRDLKATSCPGIHGYRLIPEINRRAAAGGGPPPPPQRLGDRLLRRGDKGPDVAAWQELLNRGGHG